MSLVRYSPGGNVCNLGVLYKNPGPEGATGPTGLTGATGPTGAFFLNGMATGSVLFASGSTADFKSTFTFNKTGGYDSNGTLNVNQIVPLYMSLTATGPNPNASGPNSVSTIWFNSTEGAKIGKEPMQTLGDTFNVAVGTGGNTIMYTRNCVSWFPAQGTTFTTAGYGVAWSGSMWVAVGQGTNTILYSLNGISWYPAQGTTFTTAGYGVAYGNGRWIAVGQGTNTILSSDDGITWSSTLVGSGFSTRGLTIAFNGYRWVAGGNNTPSVLYSDDGNVWSSATGSFTSECRKVVFNGKIWVAVFALASGTSNTIRYSLDGITWTAASGTRFLSTAYNVAWNNERFVAVGQSTSGISSVLTSTDGITWSTTSGIVLSSFTSGRAVSWNGEIWTVLGDVGGIITSVDGTTWDTTLVQGTNYNITTASDITSRYIQQIYYPYTLISSSATRNTDLTLDTTATLIGFDTPLFLHGIRIDKENVLDPLPNVFVVPRTGIYKINGYLSITGNPSTQTTIRIWIVVNGSNLANTAKTINVETSSFRPFLDFEHLLELNASDEIGIKGVSTSSIIVNYEASGGTAPNDYPASPAFQVNIYRIS